MNIDPLLLFAIVGAACAGSQWLAWKLKLPSILFLLLCGIVAGPISGILDPDALFGDLLFPFISISVAIILFEGGLTLELSQIRGHGGVVRNLLTIGVLITWCLMSLLVWLLFDFDWRLAVLFGAITVVTGPTVIKPLLRTVRPHQKIGSVLHWEGILVDPLGAFLAILFFEYILASSAGEAATHITIVLMKLISIGLIIGALSGYALSLIIGKNLIPDYLKETTTLISVVVAFALSESIQHESGLLTVTVMGAWLANTKKLRIKEIVNFKENLSILLISTLFIVLAARLKVDDIVMLGWSALAFLIIVQLVIRPLSAFICTIGSGWKWQEKALVGWIAPRGIVAAAISSLFVTKLQAVGIPNGELLVPLTFVLIIGTVVLQGFTSKPIGDYLGVTNPAPNGLLILGGDSVALPVAHALKAAGVRTVVADESWSNIVKARTMGLRTYFGNAMSGHAEENLDLSGIGGLAAMTQTPELNALAALHYRPYFGSDRVFLIASETQKKDSSRETAAAKETTSLFNSDITHNRLERDFELGARIDIEDVEDDDYEVPSSDTTTPLFAIDSEGFTHVFNDETKIVPMKGWRILSLIRAQMRS